MRRNDKLSIPQQLGWPYSELIVIFVHALPSKCICYSSVGELRMLLMDSCSTRYCRVIQVNICSLGTLCSFIVHELKIKL